MATPHACAALVDVFPALLRARRALVGSTSTPAVATLAVVRQRGCPRVSEVAECLGLDLSTVSRQVTHLRRRGLLDASPDPTDGRSQRLAVTDAGTEELRRRRHDLVDRLVEHLADWNDSEIGQLTILLDRLGRATDSRPTTTPSAGSPELELQRKA
jgi:DNA-binding MarR family transcriptional regulator